MSEIKPGFFRVTDVLKHLNNFDHIDPHVLQRAADRGKRVHDLCEKHNLDLPTEKIDEDCKNYFENFKEWHKNSIKEVLHTEMRVYSNTRKLTGQIDMIAIIKGDTKPSLIDIKTPLNPSITWQLQTAAYKLILDESLNIQVERRLCLLLPKYGTNVRVHEYLNHQNDIDNFLLAYDVFLEMYS